MSEEFLTVADVAQRLKLSKSTIEGLIKRGVLPSIKLTRSVRIAARDLDAFIASRRTKESAE